MVCKPVLDWPLSRPRLAADVREYGLRWLINCSTLAFSQQLHQLGSPGFYVPHNRDPLSVPSWQVVDGSVVTFLASLVLSFFFSSSTSEAGGLLSSPQRVPRCWILCSSAFSLCSFPVSLLPCLRSDTVWLVLWLVTALQGPCQWFVLRGSAGLALFRSLTVPLLSSVPSRCRCFTLLTPLAWLFVVSCGTGWASTSIDNL